MPSTDNEDLELLEGIAEIVLDQPSEKMKNILDNIKSPKQNELLRGIMTAI